MNSIMKALKFGRPVTKSILNEYTSLHELENILERNPLWAVSVDKKRLEEVPVHSGLDYLMFDRAFRMEKERLYEDNDLPPEEVLPAVQASMLFEGVGPVASKPIKMEVYEKRGGNRERKDLLIILKDNEYDVHLMGYSSDANNDLAITTLSGIRGSAEHGEEKYFSHDELNRYLFENLKQRTDAFNHGQKYAFAVPLVNSDFKPAGVTVELDLSPDELRRYFLRNSEATIMLPDNIIGTPESVDSYLFPGFKVMFSEDEAGTVSRISDPKYIESGIEVKLDFGNLQLMRNKENPLRKLIEYCMNKKYRP